LVRIKVRVRVWLRVRVSLRESEPCRKR
jgi:hypothetical protein